MKSVIIGNVPDRGGRANEMRPSMRDMMPGWSSREVKSGEMLYLPAGWFHEVTSYSTNVNANMMDGTSGDNNNDDDNFGGHMAFNYWFHPPDNLFDSEENGFASPYKSKFWAQDFQSSLKK